MPPPPISKATIYWSSGSVVFLTLALALGISSLFPIGSGIDPILISFLIAAGTHLLIWMARLFLVGRLPTGTDYPNSSAALTAVQGIGLVRLGVGFAGLILLLSTIVAIISRFAVNLIANAFVYAVFLYLLLGFAIGVTVNFALILERSRTPPAA